MANLGDLFKDCPGGYTRYDQNSSLVNFGGSKSWNIRSWGRFISDTAAYIEIYLKNVTNIRFVTLTESSCGVQYIELNNQKIDTLYYSNFNTAPEPKPTNAYNTLCCELQLTRVYNKIRIYTTDSKQFNFSYIDVDYTGELITKEEYENAIKVNFILNDNGTYKTYNEENNALEVITDITGLDSKALTGVKLDLVPDALKLLPSLDGVKLIISKKSSIVFNAIKNKRELVVMRDDFFTSQIKTINSLFINSNLSGNGGIKLAVSTDSGLTWKSFDGDYWINLSATIPQNKYEKLTQEEKELWNNALTDIDANGIDYDQLNSIDFNPLRAEKLRFAFVLNCENYSDTAKLESIMCSAKKVNYLKCCSEAEVEHMIIGNVVKIKSNIATDKLVVNISTAGITNGEAFDYDFAEHKPILGTTVLQGIISLDEAGIASKENLDRLYSIVNALNGDRREYKGYYASEEDRDNVITSPEEGDYCVVDSSTSEDEMYKGKTLKYFYENGKWEIHLIVPKGQVEIDDNNRSNDKTWSSEKIGDELDKKQDIKGSYSIVIDSSQLVKEESGEYEGFYKVPITHNLECGESFNLSVLNIMNQPFRMGVFFDTVGSNGFDLYSITKQTLKIRVEEV